MLLLILSLVIQVAVVVHILKTGRSTNWIWVVMMLPVAGSIAYLILEVLPELRNSRRGRSVTRGVQDTLNPNRDIQSAFAAYEAKATLATRQNLAQELLKKQNFAEAKRLFEQCLVGSYEFDPELLLGQARAEFGLLSYDACRNTLDLLIEKNPDYRNADAHLLYARALQACGEVSEAVHEYEALHRYFPGPEADYHFALLLRTQQLDSAKAEQLLQGIVGAARKAGKPYQRMHRQWIDLAEKQLRG